jgi:hypothetical protein
VVLRIQQDAALTLFGDVDEGVVEDLGSQGSPGGDARIGGVGDDVVADDAVDVLVGLGIGVVVEPLGVDR